MSRFATPRMDHASELKARSAEANDIQKRWQDINARTEEYKKYRQQERMYQQAFDEYRQKTGTEHPQEREFAEKRKKWYEIEEFMYSILTDSGFLYTKMIGLANRIRKDATTAVELAAGEMRDPAFVLDPSPRTASAVSLDSAKASPQEAQDVAAMVKEKQALHNVPEAPAITISLPTLG